MRSIRCGRRVYNVTDTVIVTLDRRRRLPVQRIADLP